MRWYRALLRLTPASFRDEYGAEMLAAHGARRREAHGAVAVAGVTLAAIADVVRSAALLHAEILQRDLTQAFRALRRAPGFAITAILVAALGIGANTAAFSVADFVLVRPLPFPHADRLVTLWEHTPVDQTLQLSPPILADWRRAATTFAAIGAYHTTAADLLGSGEPLRLNGAAVTPELFPVLGVAPALGRTLGGSDDAFDATTLVISDALWHGPFGGDPEILGRMVTLDGRPYQIVGVMPATFQYPNRDVQYWRMMSGAAVTDSDRNNNWFNVLGRLRDGVTVEQARADLAGVTRHLGELYPATDGQVGATVLGLREYFADSTAQSRMLLLALCGASLCVLLIACANLANLLLGRALARRRELAVRTALGAGRERLARQLTTESLVLAVAGGIGGVGLAAAMVPLLARLIPSELPLGAMPHIAMPVLVVAIALTLGTAVGFGVLPALRRNEGALSALREGTRAGGGRRAPRLRSALVVVEILASVVLLVSTGLLLRAIWRLQAVDPGFEADHVLTLRTELPTFKYGVTARRTTYYRQIRTAVEALPGVTAAGFTSFLPMAMGGGIWPVALPGESGPATTIRTTSLRFVTPGYLEAMRIPLVQGRTIAETDTRESPDVAVVSQSFVRRYFPGENPIGRHFTFAFADRTIVGVVRDVRVRGPERIAEPQAYLAAPQVPDSALTYYAPRDLAIRTTGDPAGLIPAVRAIIRGIDPEQPILNVRPLAELVRDQTAPREAQVRLLMAFAAIAFLLAAVGLHGVLAYMVTQRHQEIGIRMALGARPHQVVRLVLGQAGRVALLGIVPGVLMAYAGGRAMQSLLAGVEPGDPGTFAAVVGLCVVMVGLGTGASALRAIRVSLTTALRAD